MFIWAMCNPTHSLYTNHEISTVNGGIPTESVDRYNVGWMEIVLPKVKD